MKKRWLLVGGVVVVAAGVGAAMVGGVLPGMGAGAAGTAAKGKDEAKKEVALEFTPAEVAQPQRQRMPAQLEFSGPLVAPSTAIVRAKTGGTLLVLNVAEGSRVVAGQVLGRIDLAEQTSRLAERSASIESARASLAQAERTHASNERLAQQQFISPIALENSRAALDTARATLQAAQAAADTTRIGLRDGTVVAPIAGIVAKRHVLPGEKVAVEQQVLTLVDLARLELAGAVATHEVGRLAPAMPVQVQVEGLDQAVTGRIARIAPAAEPGTRSIGVTIELANPKEVLRAGQYAVAKVELVDTTERLTLPAAAVGSTSGQNHVWLIENGQLARRAVTLGRRDDRAARVEVLEGLQPDSQVLAARFDNLREGAKATVVASRAPAVASAAASTPLLK
ncbi:efflux RND transporter periplasmic adaptor subunit [Pseudorhodoferax sp.]|uniref:efflux RND transporter periplasmic adaptor subunit n=1 Tax=Pseudorhodoferax sp. TaxID=1993553 RepID=UPI002DD63F0F|nr:efflux RND transporter periplasmic adaptor subunit [Pseudorhodoferax sp.]